MKNNDLILQKLSKSYHGQVVFSDLSLALSPGNAYCLMAPSGTGKTTLFRILMGLETPDSGEIVIDGKVVNNIPASERLSLIHI